MSMRPTGTDAIAPAAERPGERRGGTRRKRAEGEEEADGGATNGERGAKRSRDDARQEEDDGMGSENETQEKESMNQGDLLGMNVKSGRPKRKCNLRIANEQKEQEGRRGTGRGARKGAAGRIRYIGSGAGTGRVPLAQAIVVGRVQSWPTIKKAGQNGSP